MQSSDPRCMVFTASVSVIPCEAWLVNSLVKFSWYAPSPLTPTIFPLPPFMVFLISRSKGANGDLQWTLSAYCLSMGLCSRSHLLQEPSQMMTGQGNNVYIYQNIIMSYSIDFLCLPVLLGSTLGFSATKSPVPGHSGIVGCWLHRAKPHIKSVSLTTQ